MHTWEPITPLLQDQYRLITLDLQGHGLTGPHPDLAYTYGAMASTVLDLADHLEIERFFIAGNSMGGGVSAAVAAKSPHRVSGLILIDAAGLPFERSEGTPLAFKIAAIPLVSKVI